MELFFVEKDAGAEPRLVRIPVRTPPRVTQMLYGEAMENLVNVAKPARPNSTAIQLKGVQEFIEGSKQAELLNVTDRKVELMGVVKDAEKTKQGN